METVPPGRKWGSWLRRGAGTDAQGQRPEGDLRAPYTPPTLLFVVPGFRHALVPGSCSGLDLCVKGILSCPGLENDGCECRPAGRAGSSSLPFL